MLLKKIQIFKLLDKYYTKNKILLANCKAYDKIEIRFFQMEEKEDDEGKITRNQRKSFRAN